MYVSLGARTARVSPSFGLSVYAPLSTIKLYVGLIPCAYFMLHTKGNHLLEWFHSRVIDDKAILTLSSVHFLFKHCLSVNVWHTLQLLTQLGALVVTI